MCESQRERDKWISDLGRVNRQLKKERDELPIPFHFHEIYDPQLVIVKQLICAKVVDRQRVLFGTDDGLFSGDMAKDEFVRITDKRVSDIRLCTDVDIIAIISGNRRTVRLFPMAAAISGNYDQEPPKIDETRNCSHLATGRLCFSKSLKRMQMNYM